MEKTQAMISAALFGLTAAGLIVTWIAFGQTPLRMLPLFVSLVVGMLQAGANRYACLIGGINSIIYTIVYLMLGIYGSAAQALLVSCPFQLVTFARWSKHKYKNSTEFRRMSGRARIISLAGLAVCYALTLVVLRAAGSGYSLLDGATSLLGVATSVLTLMSYIEYTWLMLVSGVLGIALNVAMAIDRPGMIHMLYFQFTRLSASQGSSSRCGEFTRNRKIKKKKGLNQNEKQFYKDNGTGTRYARLPVRSRVRG